MPEILSGQIDKAVSGIRSGNYVIVPTGALYGMAADPTSASAVDLIFKAKRRSRTNPLLLLIPDWEAVDVIAADLPGYARRLMRAFWPGRLTVVVRTDLEFAPGVVSETGCVGIRLPAHPLTRALVCSLGAPVTGTSANTSGSPGAGNVADIPEHIRIQASAVLDAGDLPGLLPSTVIDVTGQKLQILREGGIPADELLAAID